jgi:carbon-monoxide dehydrogenase medium subunit
VTRLAPFAIHRATSVEEATALIEEHGDDAALYAGGTELLLLMKLGFAAFEHLVDVKPIVGLGRIEPSGGGLRIGGSVTHRAIERSPLVRDGWPELAEMERRVANVRVRATGTLGGNLAFADPHSDPATFLLAAGATVELARGERRRALPIASFVRGPFETALERGEILEAVEVPALGPGEAMAHVRFAVHERPAATVSAWVRAVDGRVAEARVAAGSVGIVPVVPAVAGEMLMGQPLGAIDAEAVAAMGLALADAAEPSSDANGADDYKYALIVELAGRCVREAAARASSRVDITAVASEGGLTT